MKAVILILLHLLMAGTISAQKNTWRDDLQHSKIMFTATHFGYSSISGIYEKFDALITSSNADFSDGSFSLQIDAGSINTGVKARDEHLKSKDFFNVANYPMITFVSTGIQNTTGMSGRYSLTGDLTIHGITKSITINVWFRGIRVDPVTRHTKAGFQLIANINRCDFKVGPEDPFEISNEIRIQADGEFIKQ